MKNYYHHIHLGKLYIGGTGVSNGYYNNKALNNKLFNTYLNKPLYNTNDLAYFDKNGDLHHLGRADFQIKIRGYRVELEEIEQQSIKYPNIQNAVAKCINNKFIVLFYTSQEHVNEEHFKLFLLNKLPTYMVPMYYQRIKKFNFTPNGKIDRKKLPEFNPQIKNEYIESRNEIDTFLLNSISNFLNLRDVNITNDFFFIGGDSLLAINLSQKISKKYNIIISSSDIMLHPIIKDLSDYISKLTNNIDKKITKTKKQSSYPISSAQKRIFLSCSLDKNSVMYNTPGGIILNKNIDKNKLENCFKILINRHESLRTHFITNDNEISQIINDTINFKLECESISTNNINDIYSNFVKPFDLSIAPLFRTKLVNLPNDKQLLLLDMHHIISDGYSLNLILKELCDLYNENELTEKTIDYKDYTIWEHEQTESEDYKKAKEFWLNQFNDEIPILNLDTTYKRPNIKEYSGKNYYTQLDNIKFTEINNLAQKLQVTPYILLLTVYYILLSKYTSQDDIIVGTPTLGRTLPELNNIIGMFVNTLPLRNNIDHSLSFNELCSQIKNNFINCLNNQMYSFDQLIKDLNFKRDASRNPLFDTMFIYQNEGYPKVNFKDITTEYFIPDNKISKFDLSLEIIPINNSYSLRCEYCDKLFDENFIKAFSMHYLNIIDTIIKDNNIKICDIDIMSLEEKNEIMNNLNNTYIKYPKNKSFIDLFEEQVEKTPNNIAITFENTKITYKELNEKANSLANFLIENGVTNKSIVGIMLPRSAEILISFIATLKTGACYIPIDPSFPEERIDYMLSNANATFLIKTSTLPDIAYHSFVNIDTLDLNNYSRENLNIEIPLNSYAYIIYTSGSTGKPKGVILKHESLVNLTYYLNNNVEYFNDCYSNMAVGSITTMSFDIFLFETLISLQRGLNIVIANEKEQNNLILLNELIKKQNIKAIQMTPSRMEILVNNSDQITNLSNLKYITLAGEALSTELKNKILEIGDITIYNGYGPSETTVYSTFTNATSQDEITIGKPLANTYMYIFDKDMHLCPIGVPGELYISGDGVGYGYINNYDLTINSFTPDIIQPNLTMYKTGDLVKLLPNHELHYIGRKDNQVKIRGLRIELDEIEKQINSFPNVDKAVIYSCKDENKRQYIVAYLTVTDRISINNLKKYLSSKMPKYMIPSYFMILDKFPYLQNGKIDRKSLPVPENTISSARKYTAPSNKLETDIAQIYEELLSISPIGILDNFFDMGGDSLLAMSLQLELMKIKLDVSYSDIFLYPSIKELADYLSLKNKNKNDVLSTESFEKFNSILENTIKLEKTTFKGNNNILLTGVTGYLGIHILDQFLRNEKNKIYCIIRPEPGLTIEQKLIKKLDYYFPNQYNDLIGNRIIPINADITSENLGLDDEYLQDIASNIDVVVNSAGRVSHYGNYSEFKKANVDSTKNLINFCMKYNKKFYQISTISIGEILPDEITIESISKNYDEQFKESDFFINQSLDNVYIKSKFEAEKEILNSIINGLNGYIIRVGHLMNRESDGCFQSNVLENSYISRIQTFTKLNCIPDYISNTIMDITPIDCCANAILKIIENTNDTNRIFHVFNSNNLIVKDFISIFNKHTNYDIEIKNNNYFMQKINETLNIDKSILSGIITDFTDNQILPYKSQIQINSDFTNNYLNKIGFSWPKIDDLYMEKFIKFYNNKNIF